MDVLPLADIGRDPRAAFFRGNGNHIVDNAQAFGFGLSLDGTRRFGFGITDAIEPVTNAKDTQNQLKTSIVG